MKVLQLPIIICDQPAEIALALDRAGVKADYAVLDINGQEWLLTKNNIKYNLRATDLVKNDPSMRVLRKTLYKFLFHAIKEYDVFHFHSNISLFSPWLGHFKDLEILKKAGKKIVVSYWGCDIRQKSKNLKYPFNSCEVCKVPCNDDAKLILSNEFASFADLKIAHLPELMEHAPKGTIFLPAFIDTNYWKPSGLRRQNDGVFKIIHVFGNSQARGDVRGTEFVRKAVEKLKLEGLKIEFLFFDKVPHGQLKNYYEKADLVIEQLRYGTYGLTALEAMALEIPVIGYIREKCKEAFNNEIPIIQANPNNILSVLRKTIQNREKLSEIGKKSREFVTKYHNSKKVAQNLINHYYKILKKKTVVVSNEKIAIEIRRSLKFKVLLISGDSNFEKKEILLLKNLATEGYNPILSNYQLHILGKKVEPIVENKNYKIIRCYDNPRRIQKRFVWLSEYIYRWRFFILSNYNLFKLGPNLEPDIIIATNPQIFIAALMLKRKLGVKLICQKNQALFKKSLTPFIAKIMITLVKKLFFFMVDGYFTFENAEFDKKNQKKLFKKMQSMDRLNIVEICHRVLIK